MSQVGLTSQQAKQKLASHGENTFAKNKFSAPKAFFRQFLDPLVFILIFAAILSIYLKEFTEAGIILGIVVLNSVLSFAQEFRSEKAVQRLSELIKRDVLVIRDDKQIMIDVRELVPDDVVILRDGDIVPADILITEATSLSVNESQLTGESIPVNKTVTSDHTAHSGQLFTGSVIEHGTCQGVVLATGNKTKLGKIALLSKDTKKTTPYQKSLSDFSFSLLRIIGVTIILMLAFKAFMPGGINDFAQTILFTIALSMTVVPEALPMITTISLSSGALKLAKHKVVVKRLSSIEDLGRINILCTDKTGTLTEDRLTVTEAVSDDETLFQKLAYASIENLNIKNGNRHLDSFGRAFSAYVPESIQAKVKDWEQVASLPFNPASRRRRIILYDPKDQKHYIVVIGSLETVLDLCSEKRHHEKMVKDDNTLGMRQLAIAYKVINYVPDCDILEHEKKLTFLGFVNLLDPLRKTSKSTIEKARDLGIEVKILTGDSPEISSYIGRQIGLVGDGEKVYTGDELDRMTIPELNKTLREHSVFARVTPEQKYNIIQQLKIDNVVGYQGDGINDAPSLKLADVSIAVNNATDVAKDSADIVLLETGLGVIIQGIRDGRSIFVNINRYIKHAMIGDLGNFFSLAFFYVVFASDLPLLPTQLLIANLIQDLPLMTIASDNVDKDDTKKPLVANGIKPLIKTSMILGIFTALFYLAYFLFVGTEATAQTRSNLFLFFNFTQLFVILSVRNHSFFWRGVKPSRSLIAALIFFAIASIALVYIPPIASFLGFAPLPLQDLGILVVVSLAFLLLLDVAKIAIDKVQKRKLAAISARDVM